MAPAETVYTVADHVTIWIEQDNSIHIKTSGPHDDPVELTEHDARELIRIITKFVEELERG